jgi:hypothetical protein
MSAYRLSVVGSIAPPGTAWDAEGLRGNEANENHFMVLACTQARKGQKEWFFAQEDIAGGFRTACRPGAALLLRLCISQLSRKIGCSPPAAGLTIHWRLVGSLLRLPNKKPPCRRLCQDCCRGHGSLPTRRSRGPASIDRKAGANWARRGSTALVSESSGIFSSTSHIGISRMTSTMDSSPSKNRSESP